MPSSFKQIFPVNKPIIGMIHLAGSGRPEKLRRALEELRIYEEEGVDGATIEDYHGDFRDVRSALYDSQDFKIARGVNILHGGASSMDYAALLGGKFVQFDNLNATGLTPQEYTRAKGQMDIPVFGEVRFKYTRDTGNSLEQDICEARSLCEAIVTTGSGTGIEAPLTKLRDFRKIMADFPLIVGSGVTAANARSQLEYADGAIVGSYFKNGDTESLLDVKRVKELMNVVRRLR
ncbi:MAG: BtpA/SgcQ family protein [Nanoarchaeota archaeon]